MSGFGVLLRKELAEAWRTRRLPAVALLFVALGIVSPLTARYLNEILGAALGGDLSIPLPEPSAATALEQLQKNLGQLGALAAIALAMGSVSGELDHGTAALVLAQPVTRPAFLAAKLAGIAIVLGICTLAGVAVAWVYTVVLFGGVAPAGWVGFAVLAWLTLLTWAALAFLASAATGSTMAAAGIGFVALVVISLLAVIPALDQWLPSGLSVAATLVALGQTGSIDGAHLATALAGTVAIIALSVAGAMLAFGRREL
jgi:ABC-2 type transport system permease protein